MVTVNRLPDIDLKNFNLRQFHDEFRVCGTPKFHYFLIVSDGIAENNSFSLSSKSVFFFNQFLKNSVEILKKKCFFLHFFAVGTPEYIKKNLII